jgi:hypothetical protein
MGRFLTFVFALCVSSAVANTAIKFKKGDPVDLVANKVGPFANPTETYMYYSLPFCAPDEMEHQKHELGEILSGDRKVKTPYKINFRQPVQWAELCTKSLKDQEIKDFEHAVMDEYFFEMFIDNLPMWGYIGDDEEDDLIFGRYGQSRKYIYPHLHFSIGWNAEHIVAVNVTTDHAKRHDISPSNPMAKEVKFSYSVEWVHSEVKAEDRLSRYVEGSFLPASFEIHWLSIINSFVLVVLLTVFLAIILMRVLKNDFTRYMNVDDDSDLNQEEETGWKLVHGDVFRYPSRISIFCAFIGTGAHLFVVTFCLLSLALLSAFHPSKRGGIMTATIIIYALTSGVGGFVSARLYRQLGGLNWVWNTILNSLVFPGPLFAVFSFLNTVAIINTSTAALPFGTILVMLALFSLVTFPLSVIGAIAGRNTATDFDQPCRTTKVPREIPPSPWYRQWPAQMFMAGFLPFSAIYIELHYIFASVWGHKIYTLFGILYMAYIMLIIVTSFICVALTYFQLAMEDHRWWWRSFASGGSTGFFIYAYSFFYYFHRSDMFGFMQTSFYFGYMLIVSYAFFLMLGFVGFYSCLFFVRKIYRTIKCE